MYYVGAPPTYLVWDIYTPKEKTRYGFQNVVSQLNICPCCLWWCLYNSLSTVLRLQHWLKETHWVPSPHELNWELICCPFWTSGEQKLNFQLEFKLDHSRLPGMAYLFYFKIRPYSVVLYCSKTHPVYSKQSSLRSNQKKTRKSQSRDCERKINK